MAGNIRSGGRGTTIFRFADRFRAIFALSGPPRRIAFAFSAGIFIGMSPLLGLHTVMGFAAAWIFRLNTVAMLAGVYVTNPWTIVPIYTFATWIGALLLGIDGIIPSVDWNSAGVSSLLSELKPLLLPFVIGTTVCGFVSGAAGYFLLCFFLKRRHG